MQVIIPMSGEGNRFKKKGYKEPKPLISIGGKTIIEYIISLFSPETKFLFICRENHIKEHKMDSFLKRLAPNSKVISIKPHKLGPVYAVSQAYDLICDKTPTIISYCDFYLSWDYTDFKQKMIDENCDACIPCYKGFHPHLLSSNLYAGVKTDKNNYLVEIKEKHSFTENKMDTWQSSGLYYFKSGSLIKKYFTKLLDLNIRCQNEYYVSLVYNLLYRDGLRTYVYEHPFFCQWGTPEDLESYKYWSDLFLAKNKVKSEILGRSL